MSFNNHRESCSLNSGTAIRNQPETHLTSPFKSTWWKNISIEPAYALYWVANFQSGFYQENLILQKACRINATYEPDLNTPCDDESRGLAIVAFVNSGYRLISTVILTLLCAIYIGWSDRAGKKWKFILILPTIGLNLMIFSSFLHAFFWTLHPIYSIITYEFIQFVTGGPKLYYLASMLYISDLSSTQNRSLRLGVLTIVQFICLPVGVSLIKDLSQPTVEKTSFWKSLNPINITSAIELVFRKRKYDKRLILNFLLVAETLVMFSRADEKSVLYIYMRHSFHWDERQYSFFDAFKNTSIIAGLLISTLLFSKYLKIHDIKIAFFAGLWDSVAAICYLFASQSWHFYIIATLDMFHGAAFLAAKSYTTKIVDKSELGNLTSISALRSLVLLLNRPTYNLLFKSYMDVFPKCFFLISIVISILGVILFHVCHILLKKSEELEEIELSYQGQSFIKNKTDESNESNCCQIPKSY